MQRVAARIEARLRAAGVKLTLGGEPTYVPEKPEGAEWQFVAVGPTKLRYAYALAKALVADALPGAVTIFSPGKSYPGEVNPRWV
ncbi:MAG: transglutaminase family protein, partial [Verrucomicrobia bacterium]|nr:transglutaminase family protein [Verrucomicrobiota bacterium]